MTPIPNSVNSVFGPLNVWGGSYTYAWNATSQQWVRGLSSVQPGVGYLVNGNGGKINVTGTETDQTDFTISLKKGWNLIGNPFRYEVDLADMTITYSSQTVGLEQAETNGWMVGTIWAYANGSYRVESVQDGGVLPTWDGVWMLSDVDCTLTIPPIPSE